MTVCISFDGRLFEFCCRFRAAEFLATHKGSYVV